MQDGAPQPDENAVPPPLDAVSDVDSHDLSEIADLDDANGQQAGSDDEGEDLMDNISGSVKTPLLIRPLLNAWTPNSSRALLLLVHISVSALWSLA